MIEDRLKRVKDDVRRELKTVKGDLLREIDTLHSKITKVKKIIQRNR